MVDEAFCGRGATREETRTWLSGRVPFLVLLFSVAGAHGQLVEEFAVAVGPPGFGEQPLVQGDLVVWRRAGEGRFPDPMDRIQGKDISHLGRSVFDLAPYPVSRSGLALSHEYLFRGAAGSPPVMARPIANLDDAFGAEDVFLVGFGKPVATNREFVFIKVGPSEPVPQNDSIVAVAIADLSGGVAPFRVVTMLRDQTTLSRSEAASERYFVWQDRDPDVRDDTWKIYAKPMVSLFDPAAILLVADTGVFFDSGVFLGVHDNLVISQASERSGASTEAIYLFHIPGGESIPLSRSSELILTWPAISGEYAVWTESTFFERKAYGVRLFDGRPYGPVFAITSGNLGGSWLTIDKNIVAWNGGTSVAGGNVTHQAIMAAELDLPGAKDVGDVDHDGSMNITDAIFVLNYLFLGGPRPRLRLADADLDREISLSDAIVILQYLFRGGRRPGTPRS